MHVWGRDDKAARGPPRGPESWRPPDAAQAVARAETGTPGQYVHRPSKGAVKSAFVRACARCFTCSCDSFPATTASST